MIEPIDLPLIPTAPYVGGLSPDLEDRHWYWLRNLRHETYSLDCRERTLLNGIVIRVHPFIEEQQAHQIYDQFLLDQGWSKLAMNEGHQAYAKSATDNSLINTLNLRWEVHTLTSGETVELVMIDSSVTDR
jgi:hypothetical protein